MSPSLKTITLLFFAFLVCASVSIREEHSLRGPFIAGNSDLRRWDLTGSSEIGDSFIRLTSDNPSKRGAIWNNYENSLHTWEFQMLFHIHGKGMNLNGDGLAIWYARDPLVLGPVFGSKDYFSGLAVFIDTYKNYDSNESNKNSYPYISVMINNGSLHYNTAQDGIHTNIGGCYAKVRNLREPSRIAVAYDRSNLMVFLDVENSEEWKQCFRSPGIHLPTGYHFGVSASTGDLTDNHDIYDIKVLDMEPPDAEKEDRHDIMPEAEYFVLPKEYKDEKDEIPVSHEKGGVLQQASILKLVLYAAGIATMLIATVILCRKYREHRRVKMEKRLY